MTGIDWRHRRAARRRRRWVSARGRRTLARWLRSLSAEARTCDPIARRRSVLLHHRIAAARTEMLQIAAALERTLHPDPESVTLLHDLLSNRNCNSPLYNERIPAGELQTTLARAGLGLEADSVLAAPCSPGWRWRRRSPSASWKAREG